MRGKSDTKKQKKSLWKRFLHGFFNWQTLLVASAFLGFFVFAGYICGRISDSYRISDMGVDNPVYRSSEQGFLIFFIVGSVAALIVALFSAYMCDHPTFLKDLGKKLFKKKPAEARTDRLSEPEEDRSALSEAAGAEEVPADRPFSAVSAETEPKEPGGHEKP